MDSGNGAITISGELQGILRDASIGLWSYDGTTQNLTLDATCRVLFDLDPDQPTSRELLRERLHPEDLATYMQVMQRAMMDSKEFAVEYRIVHRDGSVRYISGRGRVSPRLADEPIVLSGACIDVTEMRRAQRALQERTEELVRSNHDLEQFAYVASHDLKAPLHAIEVLVNWLREDLAGIDTGDVQENLALLGQRTMRLNCLLDDLLAYAHAGRGMSEIAEVDTRQLVLDITALLSPSEGMHVEANDSLPCIPTSKAPIEQVLRNLINNAIKHHPTGKGTVRVWAEKHGGKIVFAVEDDGAGIPQELSQKVFQMFQTLKPRNEVEGSGMGLAIVKRLVEQQGGRVWFRPGRGGRGTVFKFTWNPLPAAATPERSERLHSAG